MEEDKGTSGGGSLSFPGEKTKNRTDATNTSNPAANRSGKREALLTGS